MNLQHSFNEFVRLDDPFDLGAMGGFRGGAHFRELNLVTNGHHVERVGKRHIIGWHFLFDESCNCILIVGKSAEFLGCQNTPKLIGQLKIIGTGGVCPEQCEYYGKNSHLIIPFWSITSPGKQHQKSKNHIAKYPDRRQHAGSDCRSDCRASLLNFTIAGAEFANFSPIPNQPERHDYVEDNEQPFDCLTKETSFWLAEPHATIRAFCCTATNFLIAFATCHKCHGDTPALIPLVVIRSKHYLTKDAIFVMIPALLQNQQRGIGTPFVRRRLMNRATVARFSFGQAFRRAARLAAPTGGSSNSVRLAAIDWNLRGQVMKTNRRRLAMSDITADSAFNHHLKKIVRKSNGKKADIARRILARTRHDVNFRHALVFWGSHRLARDLSRRDATSNKRGMAS